MAIAMALAIERIPTIVLAVVHTVMTATCLVVSVRHAYIRLCSTHSYSSQHVARAGIHSDDYICTEVLCVRIEAIRRGRHFSQKRVILKQSGCICPPKQTSRSRSRTSRHTRELQKRLNTARTALAKIRKAEQSSD
eukprot:16250-Heterococcus_DN1.PRE.1